VAGIRFEIYEVDFVWANWSERFISGCRTGTMNLNPSSGKLRPTSSSTRCAAARKPLQRISPARRLEGLVHVPLWELGRDRLRHYRPSINPDGQTGENPIGESLPIRPYRDFP